MPLTAAEKQRRYRERKKAKMGPEIWKRKDCERKKRARAANPDLSKKKHRENMRRWRATKKVRSEGDKEPYQAKSSLARAVNRARAALPRSPRKLKKIRRT